MHSTSRPPTRHSERVALRSAWQRAADDLESAESSLEATSLTMAALFTELGARAALAHLWDAETGGFTVSCALGAEAERLVLSWVPASDWILTAATFGNRPVLITHDAFSPVAPGRHGDLGGVRSALVVPLHDPDIGTLGALELVDLDVELDAESVAAVTALAATCTRFLAGRGIELRNVVASSGVLPVEARDPRSTIPDTDGVDDYDDLAIEPIWRSVPEILSYTPVVVRERIPTIDEVDVEIALPAVSVPPAPPRPAAFKPSLPTFARERPGLPSGMKRTA